MALIKKPEPISGLNIDILAPTGQYAAVCLQVQDLFGVTRRKFQSQEQETKDVTRFVFGLVGPDGRPYIIQTYEFTIAATPNSNLMKFLTSWLGQPPAYGWDYCELQGTGALIAVATKQSGGVPPKMYSSVSGIFPVPQQMMNSIPHPQMFAGLIAAATVQPQQAPAPQQQGYAGPPAQAQGYAPQGPPPQQYQQPAPPPQQYQAPAPGYDQYGNPLMPPAQQPVYQGPPPQQYQQPAPAPQQYQPPAPQTQPTPPPADWNPGFEEADDIPF